MIYINILYTAFNGKSNSSKVLLDNINCRNKLYVRNSFTSAPQQLINELKDGKNEYVISFGQAPLEKDVIKIETVAKLGKIYKTEYDYSTLEKNLDKKYKIIISSDAGNYLCNNLYFCALKYIKENNLKTKIIFIHIPKLNNINDIKELAECFSEE